MALVCISDYEKRAAEILAKGSWNYYQSGGGLERTMQFNRTAFDK